MLKIFFQGLARRWEFLKNFKAIKLIIFEVNYMEVLDEQQI